MRLDVARDLKDSTRDFLEKVWPVIKDWCGGGQLIPVEAVVATPFAKCLDAYSGIDHWQLKTDSGQIRGIASRIQWGCDWQTFTIRYSRPSGQSTEFQKRMAALESPCEGWLFPGLTCQAYLDCRGGVLLSVAVISTHELYRWIKENPRRTRLRISSTGEEFLYVFWKDLEEETDIRIWSSKQGSKGDLRLF